MIFLPVPPEDIFGNAVPVTDRWPYHAVASVMLAHSLLASLPEVDPEKIGITGISWGGVVTCIIAGLDNRFAFAAPVYGGGFINEQIALHGSTTADAVAEWCSLWNPVLYLPQAGMPVIFISGAADPAFSLGAWERTVSFPQGKVVRSMRPELPHCHRLGLTPEVSALADAVLKGENTLPDLLEMKVDDGKLITIWSNVFEITGAEFIYSTGDGGGLHTISATAPAPAISVNIPSDAASGWLNVRTLDRCVISTPRVYFGGN